MRIQKRSLDQLAFLKNAEWDEIDCNFCGRKDFFILARRDALGIRIKTVLCLSCGLIFISPRLTKSWYEKYYTYVDGLRREYKQGEDNSKSELGRAYESARRHGRALAKRLQPFLKSGLTLDVGSAEGGLLAGMAEVLPVKPLGIEPTKSRAEYASSQGIKTYASLIENIKTAAPDLPPASNVLCTKSLNHFLDPKYFFKWAWEILEPQGRLILEVKNFRQQARRSGRIHLAIQLDHPFMFVPETLSQFVRAAGFDILFFEVDEEKSKAERLIQRKEGLPTGHIRLVARKTSEPPFSQPLLGRQDFVPSLRHQFLPFNLYFHYLFHYSTPLRNIKRRIGIRLAKSCL